MREVPLVAVNRASLPLEDLATVPARVRAIARAAPPWTGRGRIPATVFDPESAVLLVEDGVLAVSAVRPSGRVVTLALLGAGDVWTVAAAPYGPAPAVRVDALCPSSVAIIGHDALDVVLATDAAAAHWLADRHLRRALASERRATEALALSVGGRVRGALTDLARARCTRRPDGSIRLGLRVSQERLAWLAGTTRESANRAVCSLIASGAVSRVAGRYLLAPGFPLDEGPS